MKIILYFILMFIVTGCSTAHHDSKINTTNIIPVIYKYSLDSSSKKKVKGLEKDLIEYINHNIDSLVTLEIELISSSSDGQRLSKVAKEHLLSSGVSFDKLTVSHVASDDQVSDFSLLAKKYEVTVPLCGNMKIFLYGDDEFGCTLDSMRWISIVNPERMLPKQGAHRVNSALKE